MTLLFELCVSSVGDLVCRAADLGSIAVSLSQLGAWVCGVLQTLHVLLIPS